jgi:hypothetical protein
MIVVQCLLPRVWYLAGKRYVLIIDLILQRGIDSLDEDENYFFIFYVP